MAEEDLMLSLAKSLVAGDDDNPITNLSSAYGEEDDFVMELPPLERNVRDVLDDLFGSPSASETPPAVPVLVTDIATAQPVARIAFTDAPVTLGTRGRRKKVDAGVGLLFPEMMGA